MTAGRPTDYDPSFVEQVRKLCNLGATDPEIADFFGVSVRTIYRWKIDHEEFCHAIKVGKEIADERVERSLYQKATGYDYSEEQAIKIKVGQYQEDIQVVEVSKHAPAETNAAFIWLKNRRKDDWRDKQELDLSSKDGSMSPKTIDASKLSSEVLEALVKANDESNQ